MGREAERLGARAQRHAAHRYAGRPSSRPCQGPGLQPAGAFFEAGAGRRFGVRRQTFADHHAGRRDRRPGHQCCNGGPRGRQTDAGRRRRSGVLRHGRRQEPRRAAGGHRQGRGTDSRPTQVDNVIVLSFPTQ